MKKETEKEEKRVENVKQKEQITMDYECGSNCRLCPFPGAKCVLDPEMWKYIK